MEQLRPRYGADQDSDPGDISFSSRSTADVQLQRGPTLKKRIQSAPVPDPLSDEPKLPQRSERISATLSNFNDLGDQTSSPFDLTEFLVGGKV